MNLVKIFPTCVGVEQNNVMSDRLYPYARKYLDNLNKSEYKEWGYKTTYGEINADYIPNELQFFSDYICDAGQRFMIANGFVPKALKPSIFFSEMVDGDLHGKHCHTDSFLSGVFYLKVPVGSADIKLFTPDPYKKLSRLDIQDFTNECSWETCNFTPAEGALLIWRSYIDHEVLLNKSKDGRITAVFNLSWKHDD